MQPSKITRLDTYINLQDALEAAWRNRLGKKREAVSKATELRRLGLHYTPFVSSTFKFN